MSQTVITQAFEALKAQEAANHGVVTLDEFVFASVPNLNITDPISRTETLPPAAQIVHRQAVSKTGMVNSNAVVYSVVLGADVGDFEFNWVGLLNKASGAVAMIVHAPSQKKIKTASGQQGNVLTRSFLMEYNGASTQTNITTPADTWQIDFTARLNGVDDRIRLENIDTYGAASFLKDGFLVTGTNGSYQVKKGSAYIEGLRAELLFDQAVAVATRPSKIWVDVCWHGTLTSVWASVTKITVADTLANYVSGDEQHYVFAIAEILADGSVVDLRQATPVTELMGLLPKPNVVPYFDSSSKLKTSALSDFIRDLMAVPDLGNLLSNLELNTSGGAGNIGGLAKPVTWVGFAGGADLSGSTSSDAAFAAAAAHPYPVSIPDGTYKLTANVTGDFLEGTAVTYNGSGRAIPRKVGFWSDQGSVRFHRLRDRVLVGSAVQYDGKYAPVEASFLTKDAGYDWLERSAQMHVCHQAGGAAIVGSSKSSDKAGVVGQTCIGLAGYAYADSGAGSAWGAYIEAVRGADVTSNVFGLELTAKNLGTETVITSPYNPFSQGSTIGLWLGAGGDGSLDPAAAAPSSAAIVVGKNGQRWLKGIQFQSNGLVGTDGAGTGSAVAIELARGHRIIGRHSAHVEDISGGIYFDNQSKAQATFAAFTLNGFQVHGVNTDQSAEVTLLRVLPNPTAVNFLELRAGSPGGRPNLAMSGADPNIDLQLSPKGAGIVRIAANIAPGAANTFTCGTNALPWSGGFTQAAFTVTSDETHKGKPLMLARGSLDFAVTSDERRMESDYADQILDAWSEVDFVQFQYLDRVAEKGEDGARWHFGVVAQRAKEAFERHGLDAHRFGFLCYDEWDNQYVKMQTNLGEQVTRTRLASVAKEVIKTRNTRKPVMIPVLREILVDAEQEDGTKIKKVETREFLEPKTIQVFIFNEDGTPRMDEKGAHLYVYEPVMEEVTEEYKDEEYEEVEEEYLDAADPVYEDVLETPAGSRYGIRYEEALALEAALQRRNHLQLKLQNDELAKRLAALEGQ